MTLVREFAGTHSEAAFAALVERYLGLVHAAAKRQVGDDHLAKEISQAVFIILARKAASLGPRTVLAAWLYRTTRYAAADALKARRRREAREQEAYMQSTLNQPEDEVWTQLAPLLDDALNELGETDRTALVLRYFENKSAAEMASAMRMTEEAAQKRVTRALGKLHARFLKHGVTLTATVIASAVAANSAPVAPPGLAATVTAAAVKGTLFSASLTTLIKGTMKTMTWLKLKLAIGVGAAALAIGGLVTVAVSQTTGGVQMSVPQIVQQTRAAYAALTSYSDEGKTVFSVESATVAPYIFTTKLARPNLYRIAWNQDYGSFSQTGAVWSAGNGNFLTTTAASQPTKEPSMEMALSSAAGLSGGAAGGIPGSFFSQNWGKQFSIAYESAQRKPDETIGGDDCYVLTLGSGGHTQTVWIGKKDFLIRQIQTDSTVETHTNIVVNPPLAAADFAP